MAAEQDTRRDAEAHGDVADGPNGAPTNTNGIAEDGATTVTTAIATNGNATDEKDAHNEPTTQTTGAETTKEDEAVVNENAPTSNGTNGVAADTTASDAKPKSKPPLLCLGMARTGTASLGAALQQLDVGRIHHGLKMKVLDDEWQWEIFHKAANGAFPNRKYYRGTPFSREEWDELCNHFDVLTDMGSFFAVSLIKAYPDAKVILVERDVDSWLKSIWGVFKQWEAPGAKFLFESVSPRTSSIAGVTSMKFQLGWSDVDDIKQIWPNARQSYERHYREIRAMVPPEQLLDFKLKDGWAPLCEFLGKEVPEGPFPHINEGADYAKYSKNQSKMAFKNLGKNILKLNLKKKTA